VGDIDERKLNTLYNAMGKDLLDCLNDPDVFEVLVNDNGLLWTDTFSKGRVSTQKYLSSDNRFKIIMLIADATKQIVNEEHPLLEAELPDKSRFQGYFPRVVRFPAFVIRKHAIAKQTLDDYVLCGIMTEKQKKFIVDAIYSNRNILVAGATKSGKTTLLNAILEEIAKTEERVITVEEGMSELKCTSELGLSLCTSKYASLLDILRGLLRGTPDRIVMGELRAGEAMDLLDLWNTGHGGGCASIHANSAYLSLKRLEKMILRVSINPQKESIGEIIDVVLFMERKGTGRALKEIMEVKGYDEKKGDYDVVYLK